MRPLEVSVAEDGSCSWPARLRSTYPTPCHCPGLHVLWGKGNPNRSVAPGQVTAAPPAMSSTIFAHELHAAGLVVAPASATWASAAGHHRASDAFLLLTQVPRFEPRERASAPAACGKTHAPLAAFSVPFPLAFGLALRPFWTVTGTLASRWGGLGGDGPQEMVPLAQEFSLARKSEAALPESHPSSVLGRPGAMGVLSWARWDA